MVSFRAKFPVPIGDGRVTEATSFRRTVHLHFTMLIAMQGYISICRGRTRKNEGVCRAFPMPTLERNPSLPLLISLSGPRYRTHPAPPLWVLLHVDTFVVTAYCGEKKRENAYKFTPPLGMDSWRRRPVSPRVRGQEKAKVVVAVVAVVAVVVVALCCVL